MIVNFLQSAILIGMDWVALSCMSLQQLKKGDSSCLIKRNVGAVV